ncbi:MAG TPA: hypothetical protein VG253_12580 [Streptosporangiaceae bacterium]|nr:hypothetical protein [Streptosporangiaceae bacterium]
MNVDTGEWETLLADVAALAGQVAATQRAAGVFYDAGYADATPPPARARHARPAHLRVVRGGQDKAG